jgi:formate dehydrogenase iron-sulfur subunit
MAAQLFDSIEHNLAGGSGLAPRWLVDELLREQQQITPIERFSRWHDEASSHLGLVAAGPTSRLDRPHQFRELIPVGLPQAGQQFAFEVDLDACSGCKACVTACHNLNDLEAGETWRAVGLLHGGTTQLPALQHVTTACHHCVDPACLKGCPVDAYDKDPITGIVRHLDDQCIGCQYCTFMCPYDVPKYSRRLGIVRKCDMCRNRLAVGEAPACVQSCPNSAIRIAIVNRQEAIESAEAQSFLPGAPEPGCTLPTTIYKSSRPLPRNMLPADYFAAAPQHAHWPLILMLVLTQMSVGAFVAGLWTWGASTSSQTIESSLTHSVIASAVGLLGICASTLHLGRPLYAFRAFIGWRRSWLSREIIAFGAFAALTVAYTATATAIVQHVALPPQAATMLGFAVCGVGIAGVFCSSMIYAATQRPFWSLPRTAAKFFLTAAVLGLPIALLVSIGQTWNNAGAASNRDLLAAIVAASAAKLVVDAAIFASLRRRTNTPLKRTALLMSGELASWTRHRFFWGTLALAIPGALFLAHLDSVAELPNSASNVAWLIVGLIAAFAGEICERYLYFAAVVAPKMPGAPSA